MSRQTRASEGQGAAGRFAGERERLHVPDGVAVARHLDAHLDAAPLRSAARRAGAGPGLGQPVVHRPSAHDTAISKADRQPLVARALLPVVPAPTGRGQLRRTGDRGNVSVRHAHFDLREIRLVGADLRRVASEVCAEGAVDRPVDREMA